ncbi:hypothetical protein [Nocardia sp. CA-290969]|uniref:hypothetical protein n=1 Tax=Nocardia sp. CA-290969 TaxID=3239986 RepID=UPI003D93EE6D
MSEPSGKFLRSLEDAHERREQRRRGEFRTEAAEQPRAEPPYLASRAENWTRVGYEIDGEVFIAPAGTPPPDTERSWSLLSDLIAAAASLARSVIR